MDDIRLIQIELERFLIMEARLLEKGRFEEWLDLLADDIRYVMPITETLGADSKDRTPPSQFALYDEDKQSLVLRVRRLDTGLAHAEAPHSVTQRCITNIYVNSSHRAGEYEVDSTFLIYQERRGRHSHMFIGSRVDQIRASAGSWKIHKREIKLAQAIMPATISIFF